MILMTPAACHRKGVKESLVMKPPLGHLVSRLFFSESWWSGLILDIWSVTQNDEGQRSWFLGLGTRTQFVSVSKIVKLSLRCVDSDNCLLTVGPVEPEALFMLGKGSLLCRGHFSHWKSISTSLLSSLLNNNAGQNS